MGCGWNGRCEPFKVVDLCCPGCECWWQNVRIEVCEKSWLELLSATFFCNRCKGTVSAQPCRCLTFSCGNPTCGVSQTLVCDPWTDDGLAPVRCSSCPWAGEAILS